MTEDRIKVLVLGIIGEIAPDANLERLDPEVRFRDQFPFDSVDFLTFVTRLQKELDMHIPEAECPELATLNGCVVYLRNRTERKGGFHDQSDRYS